VVSYSNNSRSSSRSERHGVRVCVRHLSNIGRPTVIKLDKHSTTFFDPLRKVFLPKVCRVPFFLFFANTTYFLTLFKAFLLARQIQNYKKRNYGSKSLPS